MDKKVEVFRALGDVTRLSIVQEIVRRGGRASSADLAASCSLALQLAQPTMSHHFRKLVDAGILREHKVGVEKYYHLDDALLVDAGIKKRKL